MAELEPGHRAVAFAVAGALAVAGGAVAFHVLGSEPRVRPPATASSALYVATLETFARRQPSRKAEPVARLRIGEEVEVAAAPVRADDGTPWRQLATTLPTGFVPEDELTTVKPRPDAALEEARAALGRAELDEAVAFARRAVALDPALREGWDLLAAVFDARGDVVQARAVYAQRAKLPALPEPVVGLAPAPAPTAGETRYVAATRLRAREQAARTADVVAELPINQPVEVLGVEGDFARVRWLSGDRVQRWRVSLDEQAKPLLLAGDGKPTEGFVAFAFLAQTPWQAKALLDEAAREESAGRIAEAATTLERAALVEEPAPETLEKLVALAAQSRRYLLAAAWAVKLGQGAVPAGASGAVAAAARSSLALYFGCAGEPPFDAEKACVAGADTVGECPPCAPTDPAAFAGDDASEEERAAMARELAQAEKEYARVSAAHRRAADDREAAMKKLRARYPGGPWLHARVEGDDAHRGQQLFVWALPFTIGGYCDVVESTHDAAAAQLSAGIPWPGPGETVEVWARGGDYANTLRGVLAAPDAEAARARLVGHAPEGADHADRPELFGPPPNVSGPYQSCRCCGC